jgi:heat shock protein HslJ
MHVRTIAAMGLMALAALPAAAQSLDSPYRASGTEPFWSLTIGDGSILYRPADGQVMRVAKPRPIIGFNGERYEARGMIVDITHVECSDGMSDRTFHDTVTVTLRGRTLKGCGGTVLSGAAGQPGALLEGAWSVALIDGRAPVRGSSLRVSFRGDRISGDAGCNGFSGSFRFARGRLNAGPLATTRKACTNPALNVQESRLLGLLGQRLTVSRNRTGKLVMTATSGQTLTLAPARR